MTSRSRLAALLLALSPAAAAAQAAWDPPPAALSGVDIVERLGEQIPPGLAFTDGQGRRFTLADKLAGGRPLILSLVYYECPMLCSLLSSGLVQAMKGSGLELGRDFDALTISFSPTEKPAQAAERQGHYLQALGRAEAAPAWTFAVGEQAQIAALTEAVGFQYQRDERTGQYAHLAALYVLTPQGKISRYLYGVTFNPRDLKLALLEAGEGRVGSTLERLLLTCYRYDPARRKYAFFLNTTLRAGGLVILAGVTTLLVSLWRRERRRAAA